MTLISAAPGGNIINGTENIVVPYIRNTNVTPEVAYKIEFNYYEETSNLVVGYKDNDTFYTDTTKSQAITLTDYNFYLDIYTKDLYFCISNTLYSLASSLPNGWVKDFSTNSAFFNTLVNGKGIKVYGPSMNSLINGEYHQIIGGASSYGNLFSGSSNKVKYDNVYNTILSGDSNEVNSTVTHNKACYSSIIAGTNNKIGTNSANAPEVESIIYFGNNNTVSNGGNIKYSLIGGKNNDITLNNSSVLDILLLGENNTFTGGLSGSAIFGEGNTINSGSSYSCVGGQNNVISGFYNMMFGNQCKLLSNSAMYNIANGSSNNISNMFNIINGASNNTSGNYSVINGTGNYNNSVGFSSLVIGSGNINNAAMGINLGSGNYTSGAISATIGESNIAVGNECIAEGYKTVAGMPYVSGTIDVYTNPTASTTMTNSYAIDDVI